MEPIYKISLSEVDERLERAEKAFAMFMDEVLPGWRENSSTIETPHRVAKMYLKELFLSNLEGSFPKITTFENAGQYNGIVFQGNIRVQSVCEHHFMPFSGVCHVSYIPTEHGRIIGLSKLNRIVEFCSRKPQVQENLTMEIHSMINELCHPNLGVAVYVEASHTCVSHRGIRQDSVMKTSKLSGDFLDNLSTREEFYNFIRDLKK